MVRPQSYREHTIPILLYQKVLIRLQHQMRKLFQTDVSGKGGGLQCVHRWVVIPRHYGLRHCTPQHCGGKLWRVHPPRLQGSQVSMLHPGTRGLPVGTGLYQHFEFKYYHQLSCNITQLSKNWRYFLHQRPLHKRQVSQEAAGSCSQWLHRYYWRDLGNEHGLGGIGGCHVCKKVALPGKREQEA